MIRFHFIVSKPGITFLARVDRFVNTSVFLSATRDFYNMLAVS